MQNDSFFTFSVFIVTVENYKYHGEEYNYNEDNDRVSKTYVLFLERLMDLIIKRKGNS